jgi:hypothetical protein
MRNAFVLFAALLVALVTTASAAPKASKAADKPRLELGEPRAPGSGSCNNESNPCSGAGETCSANRCYCKGPDYRRCSAEAKDCTHVSESRDDCGACGNKCGSGKSCWKGACMDTDAAEAAYRKQVGEEQQQRDQVEVEQKKHLEALSQRLKGGRLEVFNQYSEPDKFEGGSVETATKWIFRRFVDQTHSFCDIEFRFKADRMIKKTKVGQGCAFVD